VRVCETLSLAFFTYLAAAAWIRPLPAGRRRQVTAGSGAVAAVILGSARLGDAVVRDWAPAFYILVAYFLSGRTFVDPMPRVEAWLLDWDRRVIGDPITRFASWPRALVFFLDAIYVLCVLLVPGGFAILAAAGRSDLADYYWTIVAAAEMGSFAPLPFLRTRPPWALERPALPQPSGERISQTFLQQATTGANTLPSGHAAGSLAVALSVASVFPSTGAALVALALAIAFATIVARAHYVVDVIAGIVLAVASWAVVSASGV
jgi:membrane-associated phospholipid phosphatase